MHRFILEPYKGMKSRYHCPECNNRDKSFTRYIDTETGNYLADHVGRCNRESKCGYHYTPKQFLEANGQIIPARPIPNRIESAKKASFIPIEAFKGSFNTSAHNNFYLALKRLYGANGANHVFNTYQIGSSKRWQGANVFWQIDINGQVRTGKIMLYNPETIKRVKDSAGRSLIDWVHRFTGIEPYNLSQCFFGEHLLRTYPNKPVAIVESEKTAIIASIHIPAFNWLASGSKTGLNDKCHVLKGRKVILYPDLGCFDDWKLKADKYGFIITDILERSANDSQRVNGMDLADFLIQSYLEPDGTIDPNRRFIIENKIINLWDKAEQAHAAGKELEAASIVKEIKAIGLEGIVTYLGAYYAPVMSRQL